MKFNASSAKTILFALVASSTTLASAQDFTISILTSNNANYVEEDGTAGDDRGGMALSPTRVFYTGDATTVSLGLNALDIQDTGSQYDALFSDLSDGTVYSFGDAIGPAHFNCCTDSRVIDRLYVIDGTTGAPTGTQITLSQTFTLSGSYGNFNSTGIFSGMGFVAVHDGSTVWRIDLPSGNVTSLGAMAPPNHEACESWAYWGVAENAGTHVFLDTATNPFVFRTSVPDGAQGTLAYFPDGISDMCSFSVAPQINRWYFHAEGGGFFPCCEVVGYADAYFNLQSDFGDAPAPYPTVISDDGARHFITGSGPILGSLIDSEDEGQPNSNAVGDDNNGSDDEDGVSPILLTIGETVHQVTVTVSGSVGYLDGWIDFNRDGSWTDDSSKHIFDRVFVTPGSNNLSFAVPTGLVIPNGKTYARFRIRSSSDPLEPTGVALDGEVEDYLVGQLPPSSNNGSGGNPGGNGGGGTTNGGAPELPAVGGGAFPLATLGGLFATLLLRRRRRV